MKYEGREQAWLSCWPGPAISNLIHAGLVEVFKQSWASSLTEFIQERTDSSQSYVPNSWRIDPGSE
jgi:hypothetical protein